MLELLQAFGHFIRDHYIPISAVLSAASTGSFVVAALTFLGNRRSRDFTAIIAIQKMVREEANAFRAVAVINPRNHADYKWFGLHYLDALDVAAFSINSRILDRKSRRYEREWLKAEIKGVYEHPGELREIFIEAQLSYSEIVKFYGSEPKPLPPAESAETEITRPTEIATRKQ